MTTTPTALSTYASHVEHVASIWSACMSNSDFDAVLIDAGEHTPYFLDDQSPPFRLNPHFGHWLPEATLVGSVIAFRPGEKPVLHMLSEADFWHAPGTKPSWAEGSIAIEIHHDRASVIEAASRQMPARSAVISPSADAALPGTTNPTNLLAALHFQRARKTPWEIAQMRQSSKRAVAGHLAAEAAFRDQRSEFDIAMAFLAASRQMATEQPYSGIVALNEHAGVLHYQHYDREPPEVHRSFLIDAGASEFGYASDITRTYAGDNQSAFAALIDDLDRAQLALIDTIAPGMSYVELHDSMAARIAALLCEHEIINTSPERAHDEGLADAFFPHGLGHLIGLQTHDVAGQQRGPEPDISKPPSRYEALRLTRTIEKDQVFTIEPGIYFIPLLLEPIRAGESAGLYNWRAIDALMPCGGIRIEDNVVVGDNGCSNLTREAFASAAQGNAS
ncbi:MAG: Xaa-Pro dipeptidase [Pseudomonadaceae bacterium]|nr:Xaa-Pro dipeptidase [Pseudomonadaceae bacterium]